MKKISTTLFQKVAGMMLLLICVFSSATKAQVVNTTHAGTGPYLTIQAAINDPATVAGDVITVAPGLYPENVLLNKSLILRGARAGMDARGRVVGAPNPAVESVVGTPAGPPALNLQAASSGSIVDGFAFIGNPGGTDGVVSNLGAAPLANILISNCYVKPTGANGAAIWLARALTDLTLDRNELNGTTATQVIFLSTNLYHGLVMTNNNVLGNGGTYGLFVDGNRNVGSTARNPLLQGNLFQGHVAGINGGIRSFDNAQFLENTFNNNSQLGFQGGPRNSNFARNTFTGNGLYGMSLTGFSGNAAQFADATRGASNTIIQNNFFSNNATAPGAFADVLLSNEAPGLQNSNTVINNSLLSVKAIYDNEPDGGTDPIHATCNWFGATTSAAISAKIVITPGGVVSFTPWLLNGTDNDLGTPGFQPAPNSCGGGVPKLSTTINGVTVNSNNDGNDDLAAFNVCTYQNNIQFNSFSDQNGLSDPNLRVYQTLTTSNVLVPFCNNCSATMAQFTGAMGTASLSDPSMPGTLVMRFKAWIDANTNNMVDPNEAQGDWIQYTMRIYPRPILTSTLNGVTLTNNNDGMDETASMVVCNVTDNIHFTNIMDVQGTTPVSSVKVKQETVRTNVNFNGAADGSYVINSFPPDFYRTASLINPAMSGTLVIKRTIYFDINGNNNLDADECANDPIVYTVYVDGEAPVLTVPADVSVECDNVPPVGIASVTDDHDQNPTVTFLGETRTNGNCANNYTLTRTWQATDACGNTSTESQTITVSDNTPPTINCPAPVTVQCAGNVPPNDFAGGSASDNCSGAVTVVWVSDVVSGMTCANRYTITRTYRATDVCSNSATCTQIITVNDNTAPTFTCPSDKIIPFTGPCTFNANPTNTGSPTNVMDNCGGTVTVTFTDATSSCGYNTVITRTWKATDVCGNMATCVQMITITDNNTPYIIYASKEAKFGEDNIIKGDVGVTDANGKAEFKKNDVLDPYHVYAKNITVQMPSMVNNKHFVPATGGPNPPFMSHVANPLSGNYTQSVNGVVPAGNYKELTIKKGVTATVNGSDYGKVKIEEGCNVTFTSSNINMEELTVGKGKKDIATTNIYFTTCTAVKIRDKVTIEEDCRVNVGGPKVTFYLGDTKKDEENFMVKGDDTQITLNILVPNGKLKIDKKSDNCIMTGLFIVEKLESTGATTWNKYGCGPLSAKGGDPVITQSEPTPAKETPVVVAPQDVFQVKVYPNPSATDFSIQVLSSSNDPIMVRLLSATGSVLNVNQTVTKGSTVKLGSELKSGTYFAEVTQGANKQVVKLIKIN